MKMYVDIVGSRDGTRDWLITLDMSVVPVVGDNIIVTERSGKEIVCVVTSREIRLFEAKVFQYKHEATTVYVNEIELV